MVKLIKNLIKTGKKPIVILPLQDWGKIREYIEELEEKEIYLRALKESECKRGIALNELRKKYKLNV